jgi:hypothetical protein
MRIDMRTPLFLRPAGYRGSVVLYSLLVLCGLLHLDEVRGAAPTKLDLIGSAHKGWQDAELVEQGDKTGLGPQGYMKKVEENCFEKNLKGACDAYGFAMKHYFDMHKDAAMELRESCKNKGFQAACQAFEHVKEVYFSEHDDV